MIGKNFLSEKFNVSGNDIGEFKETIKELASRTEALKVSTNDFNILSYNAKKSTSNEQHFFILESGFPWKNGEGHNLPTGVLKIPDNVLLLKELIESPKFALWSNSMIYFVSPTAVDTIGRRANFGGLRLKQNDLARDINIAQGFESDQDLNATIIMRSEGKFRKIFAMLSEKYTYVKQTILSDILDAITDMMGEVKCWSWSINHQLTEIYIEFPCMMIEGENSMIPGLYLAASDTGHSSLHAIGTWRIGESISFGVDIDEENLKKSRKHSGEIDSRDFCEMIKEQVFNQYNLLPKRLDELKSVELSNLASEVKNIFDYAGILKAVGTRGEKELFEILIREIKPFLSYTAYDLVSMIMMLPEKVELVKSTKDKLAKAIARVPYYNFISEKSH